MMTPCSRDPSKSRNPDKVRESIGLVKRTAARVLGYGLLYATNERGREALARDVHSCGQDQELLAGLAHLYVYGLIGVCAWLYSLRRILCL